MTYGFRMAPQPTISKPLKLSDAAALMGVSTRTITRYIEAGYLTSLVLPGGHRRIAVGEIEACLTLAGAQRRRARTRSKPRSSRPAAAPKAQRKPRRQRRPKLGAELLPAIYDTSPEALAAIREQYLAA